MDWWQVIVALVVLGAGAALIAWMRKGSGKDRSRRASNTPPAAKVEPTVGPLPEPAPRPKPKEAPKPVAAPPQKPVVTEATPKPQMEKVAEEVASVSTPAAPVEPVEEIRIVEKEIVAPVVQQAADVPEEAAPEGEELIKSDPIVDDVFRVTFNTPIAGMPLMKALEPLENFSDVANLRIYAFEDNQKGWFKPDSIGIFSSLVIYLQTVTSRGSLDDLTINKFFQILDRIEVDTSCSVEGPDVQDVIAKTRQLTRSAQEFGANITLLLHSFSPVALEEFQNVAGELGFKRKTNKDYEKVGELVLDNAGKRIGNRKGILTATYLGEYDVLLSLAAGLTHPDRDPLRELICAANAFAAHWDATIVNGSGVEITNAILCTVRKELNSFYDRMRMGGIEPGSATAHRLLD